MVPTTLIGQWWRELHDRIDGAGRDFLIMNACESTLSSNEFQVDLDDCRWASKPLLRSTGDSAEQGGIYRENPATLDWGLGVADALSREEFAAFDNRAMNVREFKAFVAPISSLLPQRGELVEIRNIPGMPKEATFVIPVREDPSPTYLSDAWSFSAAMRGHVREEKVDVRFNTGDLSVRYMHKMDVVLTSYESLQRNKKAAHGGVNCNLYKRIQFHRIILDECQEIKVATNEIANLVANLLSKHRWMVSGTPLCGKIEDLHGELNFLKIWPFSLAEKTDGFWSTKIGRPFRERDPDALRLLHCLIGEVMIRHSKSQRYIKDLQPLIKMPPRTIEWRGVQLEEPSEAHLYSWLESFACDSLVRFQDEDVFNVNALMYPHIRALLPIMSKCLTHPSAVELPKLDRIRRMLRSDLVQQIGMGLSKADNGISRLSAQEILHIVQSGEASSTGVALNYDNSGRILANVNQAKEEEELREELEKLSVSQLKEALEKEDMPIPMSWSELPYWVSIDKDSKLLNICCDMQKEDWVLGENKDKEPYRPSLQTVRNHISVNDILSIRGYNRTPDEALALKRFREANKAYNKIIKAGKVPSKPKPEPLPALPCVHGQEQEVHILQVGPPSSAGLGGAGGADRMELVEEIAAPAWNDADAGQVLATCTLALKWPLDRRFCASVYRFENSKARKPYIDLLVSRRLQASGHGDKDLHEQVPSTAPTLKDPSKPLNPRKPFSFITTPD